MAIVRQRSQGASSRRPAVLAPGELVWASIVNGLENRAATGKARPVILIESSGSLWTTMGLTTNPRYRNGAPRVPINDPAAVGLRAEGWLWGDRLTSTTALDIFDHIGWIDEALAFDVIELGGLEGPTANQLVEAAYREHGVILPPHHAAEGGVA